MQEFASGTRNLTAFELPLQSLVIILCAIGSLILGLRLQTDQARIGDQAHRVGILVLGGVAAAMIVVGIVMPPEPEIAGRSIGEAATPAYGIWISLAASVGIIAGGIKVYGTRLLVP